MHLTRKQIYLTPELDEHLKRLALATGNSESFVIREALAEYVAKAAKEADQCDNPLAKLLALDVDCKATDGSREHDRDLYRSYTRPPEGPKGCAR
ncbi:MAG: ribbon-helix-helix domain-containing protein [Firmicutes bacterium]|nr:ribbon-helix-helix domain-containing protein [Bacillota bacterium]